MKFDLKYERVLQFYFYYGCIGHMERNCMLPKDKQSIHFGIDLRASPFKKFIRRSWSVPALKPVVA